MNFLNKLKSQVQRFFIGRNGVDILSRDLNFFALALMLLDSILGTFVIYWIGLLIFVIAIFRMCSKNIRKRSTENNTYIAFRTPIISRFKNRKKRSVDKKNYRYYKCSSCRQQLRVPKGKGKIEIACPKCGSKFTKIT